MGKATLTLAGLLLCTAVQADIVLTRDGECTHATAPVVPQLDRDLLPFFRGLCARDRGDVKIQNPPLCPAGSGFRPLGNTYPANGVVVRFQMSASGSRFIAQLAGELSRMTPPLPLTVLVAPSELGLYEMLSADFEFPGLPINTVVVSDNRDDWAQDFMEIGVSGPASTPTVLPLDEIRDRGGMDAQTVAAACGIESLDPLPARFRVGRDRQVIVPRGTSPRQAREMQVEAAGEMGGNVEGFPGGITVFGDSLSTPARERLRVGNPSDTTISVRTSWLRVGHVDEVVTSVPTSDPAPCNFALLYASPRAGIEALEEAVRTAPRTPLEPGVTPRAEGETMNQAECLTQITTAAEAQSCQELIRANERYEELIRRDVDSVAERVRERTGCSSPRIVAIPQLFRPSERRHSYGTIADRARPLNPNAVNMLVVNGTGIMAEQAHPVFATVIKQRVESTGLSAVTVDASQLHHLGGSVHCATSAFRVCR